MDEIGMPGRASRERIGRMSTLLLVFIVSKDVHFKVEVGLLISRILHQKSFFTGSTIHCFLWDREQSFAHITIGFVSPGPLVFAEPYLIGSPKAFPVQLK